MQFKAAQIDRAHQRAISAIAAVADLRILQTPLPERGRLSLYRSTPRPPSAAPELAGIADERLRAALRKPQVRADAAAARRAERPRDPADIMPHSLGTALFCLISTLVACYSASMAEWPRECSARRSQGATRVRTKTPSGRSELSRRVVLAVLAAGAIGAGVAMLTLPAIAQQKGPRRGSGRRVDEAGAGAPGSRARPGRTPRSLSSNTHR